MNQIFIFSKTIDFTQNEICKNQNDQKFEINFGNILSVNSRFFIYVIRLNYQQIFYVKFFFKG